MNPRDVVYVTRDGQIDTARYDRVATGELLKVDHAFGEVLAIQMIMGRYEVYALDELRLEKTTWLKGPPKFVTDDYDAAVTWAVLMCGRVG